MPDGEATRGGVDITGAGGGFAYQTDDRLSTAGLPGKGLWTLFPVSSAPYPLGNHEK